MDDQLFEVTDLKQWTYCQRIVFYRYCLPTVRPVTSLMHAGQASHRDEGEREVRRSLRTYGLAQGERHFDIWLRSPRLGLRGRLDLAIALPDRATPGAEAVVIEYKDTERATQPHFMLQLAAYALLLEEAWGVPVPRGFLYAIPTRRAEAVPITPALRRKVMQTVSALHAAVQSERLPPAPISRRPCVTCEFRRFCNDVV